MKSIALPIKKTGSRIQLNSLPPLSLYIHFPWCIKKCPYCDFNSHEWRGNRSFPEEAYLKALSKDLEQALPSIWGRRIHTIFIGGGTPSLMSAKGLDQLLSNIRALLPISADIEITLEANPGTFESEKFAQFRDSGINRLSIGIQSFNSTFLKLLGRIHNGLEARKAIDIAQRLFSNFNIDLMYALPKQTLNECREDIETALSYRPPHLSIYHLTLEPNTVFYRAPPPAIPDDEIAADMSEAIAQLTSQAGYQQYEVSAYAKPQKQCRHNLNYWEFGDYLGIGAGAHSKLSFPDRILRQIRYKHPNTYMTQCQINEAIQEQHEVAIADLPFEFMLNQLRLSEGFPIYRFTERTGLPITVLEKSLEEAQTRGLIERDHQKIMPTALGRRFLNDLQSIFLANAFK